jgi:phosphoglycolate phosphatase-like HAD superfamily hydrolase
LALMASCGAAASETLLIGDSPIDIEAGRRAGVFTVAVGHGFCGHDELRTAGPDALVADFAALLELATRSGW